MKIKKLSGIIILGMMIFLGFMDIHAQDPNVKSFLLVGDTHWDRWADHDSTWLVTTHPDDYRQSQNYTANTVANFDGIISELLTQSKKAELNIKGIIQLGDLVEGLAGTGELAARMQHDGLNALRTSEFSVPWIITKGNHDITGPGAKEAYDTIASPFISKQLNQTVTKTYYSYMVGADIKVIVLDCWDSNLLNFLRQEFNTTAKFKIICTHMPVIPVTGRLWHIYQTDDARRDTLLNLIAKNKALVLCGHLHKYSYVRRMTPSGAIDQIMISTVMTNSATHAPTSKTTTYGPGLVDLEPSFDPTSDATRRAYLTKEAPFIKSFWMDDMPGYGILSLNSQTGLISLKSYAGLGQSLYETKDIVTTMYSLKVNKTGNGTVSLNPNDTTYAAGTRVALSAVPELGWKFAGWSGDFTSSKNIDTVTIDTNKIITATFTQLPAGEFELRVISDKNGKVDVSPAGPYYASGTVVTLNAVANAGYKFSSYSGDFTGTAANVMITMDANKQIQASFVKDVTAGVSLLEEQFEYSVGDSLTNQGWKLNSPTTGPNIYVQSGNLSYTGYPSTGNSISLVGITGTTTPTNGQDLLKTFTEQSSGAVYVSFLLNVASVSTSQDFFLHLTPTVPGGRYVCRVYFKGASGGFNIGVSKGNQTTPTALTDATQYAKTGTANTVYSLNTTYLVVLKYEYAGDAAGSDDLCKLYMNPSITSEPDAADAVSDAVTTPIGDAKIGAVMFRQGATAYNIQIDALKISTGWIGSSPATEVVTKKAQPSDFTLNQNYPNPFNPTTTISYSLPKESKVKLSIYNVTGGTIAELVNSTQSAGVHSVEFNASKLASGTYFYKISAGEFTQVKKMIILK